MVVGFTGAEMTLIREEYVDSSNIIEGQKLTVNVEWPIQFSWDH